MMRVPQVFSIKKARQTQKRLSEQVILEDRLPKRIRLVAGVDVAYTQETSIGATAVLDYTSLRTIEKQTIACKTRFPYVPSLLSFREIPPAVFSTRKLMVQPDVFLVDGHGFAHPFQCGFACHFGLVINKPTIGVAKSKLVGEVEETRKSGSVAFVKHEGETIGAELIGAEARKKPIYVSVGHMVSLNTAIEIVRHCIKSSRMPEPILEAHKLATAEKRKANIQ